MIGTKILLVEDEDRLASHLVRGLGEEGHQVDWCSLGRQALEQASSLSYDLIVLDWMLPDIDGLSMLRELRARGMRAPVLMLTARGSVEEKVAGLRGGADDYLVKPFSFSELLARIEALHRRSAGTLDVFHAGDVTLDGKRRVLRRGDREVELTSREYALARELFGRAGDVLPRFDLFTRVWGESFEGEPNIVEVYIGYLRRKLESLGTERVNIRTIRGAGYKLSDSKAGAP